MTKVCLNKECEYKQIAQSLERFSLNKKSKDGRASECKSCVNKKSALHYQRNKERIKNQTKEWKAANKERCIENNAEWYLRNKEEYDKKVAQYEQTKKGKEVKKKAWRKRQQNGKNNQWYRSRYKKDIGFRILILSRSRQHCAYKKQGMIKKRGTMKDTGCTVVFFITHIEKQFLPGMTWENQGKVWQIDHIKPCAAFDLTKKEEQLKCFHYLNQRPLWTSENSLKKDKYEYNDQHERMLAEVI